MKVFCILSTSSLTGGSSLSFVQYCTEIRKKEDIDLVVSVPCKGPAYDYLKKLDIKTEIVPVRFNIYPKANARNFLLAPIKILKHLMQNIKQEHTLLDIVKKHKPDIIYTNVGVVNIGYNVAKKLHIPHVYHLREYQNLDFGMKIMPSRRRFIEKLQSSYTICITKGIQEHFNLTNNRNSRVVYDGLLTSGKSEKDSREKQFLFVGRLSKEKNPFSIIRAFSEFCRSNNNYKLLLAGEAVSEEELSLYKKFCKENNLNDNVCFLGTRNDIDQLMQKAYAVIVASDFEGLGRVTIESMLNDCIVIGRNTTGTKEQFDNGLLLTGKEIGVRFEGDEDLCEKMHLATSLTKEEYCEYTKRAKTVVEHLYTPKKCADDIYDFFKYIIEQQ